MSGPNIQHPVAEDRSVLTQHRKAVVLVIPMQRHEKIKTGFLRFPCSVEDRFSAVSLSVHPGKTIIKRTDNIHLLGIPFVQHSAALASRKKEVRMQTDHHSVSFQRMVTLQEFR